MIGSHLIRRILIRTCLCRHESLIQMGRGQNIVSMQREQKCTNFCLFKVIMPVPNGNLKGLVCVMPWNRKPQFLMLAFYLFSSNGQDTSSCHAESLPQTCPKGVSVLAETFLHKCVLNPHQIYHSHGSHRTPGNLQPVL